MKRRPNNKKKKRRSTTHTTETVMLKYYIPVWNRDVTVITSYLMTSDMTDTRDGMYPINMANGNERKKRRSYIVNKIWMGPADFSSIKRL